MRTLSKQHDLAPMSILRAVLLAARRGLVLPLVWNTGGYDSVASLRLLEGVFDIFMPDMKYASRTVARKLSSIDNYPEVNQAAVKEMHRQVGDLQLDEATGLARRGVLVRRWPRSEGGRSSRSSSMDNASNQGCSAPSGRRRTMVSSRCS